MASLTEIYTALQNGVAALQTVAKNITTAFPQTTVASTTVPSSVGAVTFTSSQATGFMLIALSSGVTVKVPFYNQ